MSHSTKKSWMLLWELEVIVTCWPKATTPYLSFQSNTGYMTVDHLLMSVSTHNMKINVLGAWELKDKADAMATWLLFLLAHVSPSCP